MTTPRKADQDMPIDSPARSASHLFVGSLLSVALVAPSVGAEELRPERIAWEALQFRASKLFVTADAGVSLERQGKEMLLRLNSEALGRRSETRLWVDAATARAEREERLKLHREAELRSYVYAADHALKIRYLERPSAQGREPLASWTEKSRQEQPFGAPGAPLPELVTTPSALLYLLAASPLDKMGDVLEMPIFADERLVTARAEVIEELSFTGEIAEEDGGVHRPGVTLRIRLTGRDPAGGVVDLDLLGLEGDLEILLERDTRLLLAIRGGMPIVGKIDVKLREVRFKD